MADQIVTQSLASYDIVSYFGFDPSLEQTAINTLKANGISGIQFDFVVDVDPQTGAITSTSSPTAQGGHFNTLSLDKVQQFAQLIHDNGMTAVLKPHFMDSTSPGINIALLSDVNTTAVQSGIGAYLNALAPIAQQTGAASVVLGTEMRGLQDSASWWNSVIDSVRAKYSGLLGYAATYYPFYTNAHDVRDLPFASKLDYVGADVYLPTGSTNPTYDQAIQAWYDSQKSWWTYGAPSAPASLNILSDLKAVSDLYGKPLLLTETGYPSTTTGAMPNQIDFSQPDQALQTTLAKAEVDALSTITGDWFGGLMWLGGRLGEFSTNYNPQTDAFYSLYGKQGFQYLASYLSQLQSPIMGGTANDTLTDIAGSHVVNGGAGFDVLLVTATHIQAAVHADHTRFLLQKADGSTDLLDGVERVTFTDGVLALDIDGHAGQAFRLYQAAFNRVPDTAGEKFWTQSLDRGTALVDVAAAFVNSGEFGTRSDAELVTTMYQNVLHRAPDQAGYDFHMTNLAHGESRADLLMQFSESAENQADVIGQIKDGIWLG